MLYTTVPNLRLSEMLSEIKDFIRDNSTELGTNTPRFLDDPRFLGLPKTSNLFDGTDVVVEGLGVHNEVKIPNIGPMIGSTGKDNIVIPVTGSPILASFFNTDILSDQGFAHISTCVLIDEVLITDHLLIRKGSMCSLSSPDCTTFIRLGLGGTSSFLFT